MTRFPRCGPACFALALSLAAPVQARAADADPASPAETAVEQTAAAQTAAGDAERAADPRADKVIEGFLKACHEDPSLSPAVREQIVAAVERGRQQADGGNEVIADALCLLSLDFREALVLLGGDDPAAAEARLSKLAVDANPYLAADAAFYLARAHVNEERFEEALPLLVKVTSAERAEHTLHAGEAMFLRGLAEARLLKRKAAAASLATFLKENPDAPERLRSGAHHLLEELKTVQQGSIVDVEGRMDYSRRRLALERSDQPTQTEQKKIVAMLDKLIAAAEEKEKSGSGSGSGSGKGRGRGGAGGKNPGGGAARSAAGAGKTEIGPLHRVARGKDDNWARLKDKDREKVLSALKAKFPDRYQELIEQYYKSFEEEQE